VLIWVKNNETVNSVDKDNEIVFKLFANGSVEGRILKLMAITFEPVVQIG